MSGSVAEEIVERMRADGSGVVRESRSKGTHMSATAAERTTGLRTAKELWDEERRLAKPAPTRFRYTEEPTDAPSVMVRPLAGIEDAKQVWNTGLEFRDVILSDPACYDIIDGRKEMNRTGATRLALAFGLNIEESGVDEGRVELADSGDWDYRFRVRVRVSRGARFVDGIGSCRISEIPRFTREKGTAGSADYRPAKEVPLSQREHFALTKAATRAKKRAIEDILGGTESD